MEIPKAIRQQVKEYERAGFHVVKVEPRNGAHFKLWFAEFDNPQFITKNVVEWRSLKNNIAHYKRLAAKEQEEQEERDEFDND